MLAAVPSSATPSPDCLGRRDPRGVRQGNIVVLVDDEDRRNEATSIFAADFVTPEKDQLLAKFGAAPGLHADYRRTCATAAAGSMAQAESQACIGTNFTVANRGPRHGVSTGISRGGSCP